MMLQQNTVVLFLSQDMSIFVVTRCKNRNKFQSNTVGNITLLPGEAVSHLILSSNYCFLKEEFLEHGKQAAQINYFAYFDSTFLHFQ